MTFKFEPEVLRVDNAEVEVLLPVSGIIITFRCGAREAPVAEHLIQVSCMQNKCVLWETIQVSRGQWLSARSAGAVAIAEHRRAYAERSKKRLLPFQFSFRFQ